MISNESKTVLGQLGRQLLARRLQRNDRQSDFAARLGVSIPTLRKLEQGEPTVAMGTWVDAVWPKCWRPNQACLIWMGSSLINSSRLL